MPLLSNIEKKAFVRGESSGEEKGTRQTLHSNITNILRKRFEVVPFNLIQSINNIQDIPLLQRLVLETISVDSLEEFQELINEANSSDIDV